MPRCDGRGGLNGGCGGSEGGVAAGPTADVDLVYAPNALLQSKILQHLLVDEGKKVADLTVASAQPEPAPVLLVFISKGVEAEAVVRRALISHKDALLVAVHEGPA